MESYLLFTKQFFKNLFKMNDAKEDRMDPSEFRKQTLM